MNPAPSSAKVEQREQTPKDVESGLLAAKRRAQQRFDDE
jgi:hypothetical protein